MNWEIIRTIIDVLTVLMAVVMIIVLYIAWKSYKKIGVNIKPLMNLGNMGDDYSELGQEEGDEKEDEEKE